MRGSLCAAVGGLLLATPLQAQLEVEQLFAPGGRPNDLFGNVVDLDGGRLAVGVWLADRICPSEPNCNSGAVWIFERRGAGFEPVADLWPADGLEGDKFGRELSLQGELLAVNSGPDGSDVSRQDRVHVFERDSAGWNEVVRLRAPDQERGDLFGRVLLVHGEAVLAGAPGDDHSGFEEAGSVHVFERVGAQWRYQEQLIAWVPCPEMLFGSALAANETHLFVGSPGDAWAGNQSGSVQVFRRRGRDWVFEQRLVASDADWNDRFGAELAVDGSRLVVSARGKDVRDREDAGALYVFDYDGNQWQESARLVAAQPTAELRLGWSLGLRGDLIVAGTPSDDEAGPGTGAMILFHLTREGWRQASKLTSRAARAIDFMGTTAALSGDLLVAGATGVDGSLGPSYGAVHVFEVPTWASLFCGCGRTPCASLGGPEGCPNSRGRAGRLGAAGSRDLVTGELRLVASGLPSLVPAVLIFGAPADPAPFGNGWRCVTSRGGAPLRLTRTRSNTAGRAAFGPGLTAALAPYVRAGERWSFQVQYADSGGPCGARWNVTQAISVEF